MKRALITGGASGIGYSIAERLAKDGFQITIVDLDEKLALRSSENLLSQGYESTYEVCDLANPQAIDDLIEKLPVINALINNAGIFYEKSFYELMADDFVKMNAVNLIAVAKLTQGISVYMPTGSKIVNIASRAYLGALNHAHYVASKAAVVGYTRAAAMELAKQKILVNAVAPGLIETPLLHNLTPQRLQEQLSLQPTGAAGKPEDIANAVSFLANPEMDFITGQVIFVDGGKSLGGLS